MTDVDAALLVLTALRLAAPFEGVVNPGGEDS